MKDNDCLNYLHFQKYIMQPRQVFFKTNPFIAKCVFVKMFSSSELYYLTKLDYTTENVIALHFVKSLIYSKVFLSRFMQDLQVLEKKKETPFAKGDWI